jgi:peptide-methionine (S)-S-oxide reductase
MVLKRIVQLPDGFSIMRYKGKKYGVTRTGFNAGKSYKIFAEELGGTDFISLNYYVLEAGNQLNPCEMPAEKIMDFLMNHELLPDNS